MPRDLIQANRYRFFAVGALGTFMATLDGSIVNVALPTIAANLDVSVDLVSWVVLSYSLTLISLLLVYGTWTQRRGYPFAYKFGFILFTAGSLICAVAPSIYLLILGRVVQGAGSAMFAALGPGMVTAVFPKEERGKGIGMMVMMVSAGLMTGPPLGGLMLGVWSWRLIFLINLPVGVIGLFFVFRYFGLLAKRVHEKKLRLTAAVVLSFSMVLAVFTMKMINRWSLSDPRIWGLAAVSLAGLILFLRIESMPDMAMIGLGVFRNRRFTTAIAAQLAHFTSQSGVMILIPFYLERVKGLAPREVGLYLVILPILMFVLAPLAGRLSDRIGFRALTSAGLATEALGMFLLSKYGLETSPALIIVSLVIIGVGVGSFASPNSSALMGSVTRDQRAITSSILATNRNIGLATGVALGTTLFAFFESRSGEAADGALAFLAGFQPVTYVAVGFALAGALLCLTRPARSG
ncbi:MAG TPA: MFS transporter [Acidobacteriota bacterium]|nr:MFS transporter [Acidobacteriota bacterium]